MPYASRLRTDWWVRGTEGVVPQVNRETKVPSADLSMQGLSAPNRAASGRVLALDDYPLDLLDAGDAGEDLGDAVAAELDHALLHCDPADVVGGPPLHGQPLDLLAHEHHLVERHPAPVPGLAAVRAADGPVQGRQLSEHPERNPVLGERLAGGDVGLLAPRAQAAGEPR